MGLKWDDAKPAEKLLALYTTLLTSRQGHSLTELARLLGCSKQTVERLIDQIESSCFGKIATEKVGKESFYMLKRPKDIPRVCLDSRGLSHLALCREFSQRLLPAGMQKRMERSLMQAFTYQEGDGKAPSGIGEQLNKGYIDYGPFESIFENLVAAIADAKVCLVTYRARRNGAEKTWAFAPKRLLAYHECIYALGWAVTAEGTVKALFGEPLLLPLHRFVDCQPTGRSSKRLAEPKPASALGVMAGKPFEVTVRFSAASATYAAERQWSERQEVTPLEDGGIRLTFTATSEAECIAWALSFADTARVLGPDWLVEKIRAKIAAMAELYN
ncbi:MAG: WYL domain-containing protein [Desulfovibrio sp.]|nr:WYL domain-containing protein [Desulfovibrio sp.]